MEQPEGSPIYDYAVIEGEKRDRNSQYSWQLVTVGTHVVVLDLDPSNRNGFHVIYDREVSIPATASTKRAIQFTSIIRLHRFRLK